MKNMIYSTICAGAISILCGCSSNANQKIAAPLFGVVRNNYYIFNVSADSDLATMTNALKNMKFASGISTNSAANGQTGRMSLGKGNDIIAVDNQFLVGHDIGNATSNDISGSASIPISL